MGGGQSSSSPLFGEESKRKNELKRNRNSNLNFETSTIWKADNLDVMRGMNSETVDLVYLDPPFKKQKPFKSKMTARTEDRLLEYLRICEGYTDSFGVKHKPRDKEFANQALEYIASLRNDKQEIIMQFNDAWDLDGIKSSQLEKLKADRVDIYNLINAIPDNDTKAYMIFMGVRILEMHRVLKKTGTLYLHCDYEVNSYIRILLDLIFGRDNLRNEIVWSYNAGGASDKFFARKHDTIYFYTKSTNENHTFNVLREPYATLGADNIKGMHPDGRMLQAVWPISKIANRSNSERIGYPTQKPLALLERIIKVSSNENDLVFDPFAGCATAVDAAYNLNRQWVACDLSLMSVILLRLRLEGPGLLDKRYPYKYTETEAPIRNDIKQQIDYSYEGIAKRVDVRKLYGAEIYTRQNGRCVISNRRINFKAGDIDHIVPLADGGSNDMENLQFISTEEHRNKTARENSNR